MVYLQFLGSKVSSLFQKKKTKRSAYTSVSMESQPKQSANLPVTNKKEAPPRPPPFAATHPSQAEKLKYIQKCHPSSSDNDVDISSTVSQAENGSMENLLTSLQEIDELDPLMPSSANRSAGVYEVVEPEFSKEFTPQANVITSSSMVKSATLTSQVILTETVVPRDCNHHTDTEQQLHDLDQSPPRIIVRPKKSPNKSRKQEKPTIPVAPPRTKRKSVKSDVVTTTIKLDDVQ